MKKTAFRTKSIGTKVTEEEFARFEELAAAAGQSRAEWVRARLLSPAAAGAGTEQVLADFDSEKQAAQANGEHFNNGTMYHYDSGGNQINDGTYQQTDVDIDQSLAIGLHDAGVQSSAALNSFMKDAAMNAAGGFVLAGAGTAISELWPAAENLPLLRQVSRVLTNNSLKHIINEGHLAEFQALDSSLTLNNVVDVGINVAETGTQIGTKTFVKTVTIGGQQVEVKAVLNSNNGLRSVYPLR